MLIINKQSSSKSSPFSFGDIVIPKGERFVDIMHSEVIYLPDGGYDDAHSFQLSRRTSGVYPFESSMSDWSMLKRVGRYIDLPDEVKQLLGPYRRGVVINGSHEDIGIDFLDKKESYTIQLVLHGHGDSDDIPVGLGTQSLIKKFFRTAHDNWRVFVHRKEDWCTWDMHGPYADEEKARRVFAESIEESKRNPPRELRRGVYENTGQINVVVLYQGFDKRDYWSYLVGQGEAVGS